MALIHLEAIGTTINVHPGADLMFWRTERNSKRTPHGVALAIGGYDRRSYFPTERERDEAFGELEEKLGPYLEASPAPSVHVTLQQQEGVPLEDVRRELEPLAYAEGPEVEDEVEETPVFYCATCSERLGCSWIVDDYTGSKHCSDCAYDLDYYDPTVGFEPPPERGPEDILLSVPGCALCDADHAGKAPACVELEVQHSKFGSVGLHVCSSCQEEHRSPTGGWPSKAWEALEDAARGALEHQEELDAE